jgi:hypothetical protein
VSKNYPAALIAIEKKIMVGEMVKRFDILVFDRQHQPLMMVECKAMNVVLGEEVLRQVLRYHVAVPVTFLVITNGTYCMVFKKEERELVPLDEFPDFK